jgi:hypothetical protein
LHSLYLHSKVGDLGYECPQAVGYSTCFENPHAMVWMRVDKEECHYTYAWHKLWMLFMAFYLFEIAKIYVLTCMHLSILWLSKFGKQLNCGNLIVNGLMCEIILCFHMMSFRLVIFT